MGQWEVGAKVTLQCVFTKAGQPTDTTAALTLVSPTGASTTPTVTRTALGTYQATVTATVNGTWRWRWVGTGAVEAVHEGSFGISKSKVLA